MSARAPGLLFIVNSLSLGGAEKQVVTLLNHLDESRFRLHLAYLKRGEHLLAQLNTAKLDELLCCDVSRGVERKALRQLQHVISARHIDAVVCTNTYSMLYGYLARLAGSRPGDAVRGGGRLPKLATVFHTTLLRTYKEKAQMLLYQRLFKRSDLLLYVCENQRDYWRDRGLRAAADGVVHNGIDVDYFSDVQTPEQKGTMRQSLGFGPQDYVIGLCSSLRPEKAHGDLLQAVARLRAQGLPAKALFIGDGAERETLERRALELGLREHLRITGLQQDVRPFIGCCDVMTLVSHAIETFSLAALESMALGKPLVMSDIGGASEQVLHGQNGFLFEPGNVAALAAHLSTLTLETLRVQMGAAARRRVRQLFTVDAMTAGFTEQMTQLLGTGRSRPTLERRAEQSGFLT
ncbi:MAG: glycosyl transferase group 1 [Gammaproteobacteria bacterium]|nr:glycosyl transferase group 1 [Gammaproteobacteria bacterium]